MFSFFLQWIYCNLKFENWRLQSALNAELFWKLTFAQHSEHYIFEFWLKLQLVPKTIQIYIHKVCQNSCSHQIEDIIRALEPQPQRIKSSGDKASLQNKINDFKRLFEEGQLPDEGIDYYRTQFKDLPSYLTVILLKEVLRVNDPHSEKMMDRESKRNTKMLQSFLHNVKHSIQND